MLVLIYPGNLATLWKDTMVQVEDTEMRDFYEYPVNRYTFLTLEY